MRASTLWPLLPESVQRLLWYLLWHFLWVFQIYVLFLFANLLSLFPLANFITRRAVKLLSHTELRIVSQQTIVQESHSVVMRLLKEGAVYKMLNTLWVQKEPGHQGFLLPCCTTGSVIRKVLASLLMLFDYDNDNEEAEEEEVDTSWIGRSSITGVVLAEKLPRCEGRLFINRGEGDGGEALGKSSFLFTLTRRFFSQVCRD